MGLVSHQAVSLTYVKLRRKTGTPLRRSTTGARGTIVRTAGASHDLPPYAEQRYPYLARKLLRKVRP